MPYSDKIDYVNDKSFWLREICNKNGLVISEKQLKLFEQFVIYLLEWNTKINLISRTDEQNVWSKHLLGSISFLFKHQIHASSNIADVGTGGGFPGIPMAILFPESQFTLIDSIKKKITAVEDIITKLQLANIRTCNGRAENISQQIDFHQSYDYVIARAVAPVKDIVQWCTPFLKTPSQPVERKEDKEHSRQPLPRGSILLLKGGDLTQEIDHAKIKTKLKSIEVFDISIDGVDPIDFADKKLVVIQP